MGAPAAGPGSALQRGDGAGGTLHQLPRPLANPPAQNSTLVSGLLCLFPACHSSVAMEMLPLIGMFPLLLDCAVWMQSESPRVSTQAPSLGRVMKANATQMCMHLSASCLRSAP